jgi:hypothetical protein
VWREICAENNKVRAVKVLSKTDPRLSTIRQQREIVNFTALKEVLSHSSMYNVSLH